MTGQLSVARYVCLGLIGSWVLYSALQTGCIAYNRSLTLQVSEASASNYLYLTTYMYVMLASPLVQSVFFTFACDMIVFVGSSDESIRCGVDAHSTIVTYWYTFLVVFGIVAGSSLGTIDSLEVDTFRGRKCCIEIIPLVNIFYIGDTVDYRTSVKEF